MEKELTLNKKNVKPQEQLQDLLTCQICYTLAKNIIMCPHCSKIYCEPCIKKSLSIKSECPHCRANIKDFHSMANCQRFVNEVKAIVEEVLKEKQKENYRCEQHDVPLNYFCLQCQRSVCCECKMFGDHQEHELIQVEKKYQEKYQQIRSMLAELKVSVKQKQQLIGRFQQLLTEKNSNFNEQIANANSLQKSCEEWYAKQRKTSKEQQKQNTQKLGSIFQKIDEMRRSLRSEYSRLKKQGKYGFGEFQQNTIGKAVLDFNSEVEKVRQKILGYESHLKQLIPAYDYKSFRIRNFSQMKLEQKSIVFSDPVQILGCSWRLKIYPNGSESVEGKYLSIYVMMLSNQTSKTNPISKDTNDNKNQLSLYEYSIEISANTEPSNNVGDKQKAQKIDNQQVVIGKQSGKAISNAKTLAREYASTFEPGQSWGYIKFIELKELQAGGYIKNDTLSIKYGIRKPDYFNYYQALVNESHFLQQQMLSIVSSSDSKPKQQTNLKSLKCEYLQKDTSAQQQNTQ